MFTNEAAYTLMASVLCIHILHCTCVMYMYIYIYIYMYMYMYTRTICAFSSQRCDSQVVSLLTRHSVAHFLISTHVLIPCARESRAEFRGAGGGGRGQGN